MTSHRFRVFSRDELSGLLAALDDPETVISVAALRALVRLPIDPAVGIDLKPYRALFEPSAWAWSTWIPDKTGREQIDRKSVV